ncbi:MAG: hypothetical protein ABL918_04705 [Chakrabartia sp.]
MKRNLLAVKMPLALLSVAAFLFSVPTLAQLKPESQLGSRIPTKPTAMDPARAGLVKKGFAKCLYRKSMVKTSFVLENSDPVTIDYKTAQISETNLSKELGMEFCLGEQVGMTQLGIGLKFSPALLRSMLQEEAYLAKFQTPPKLPADSVEDVKRKYVSTGDALKSAKGLGGFSDCLAFRDTLGSDAILRTMPDGKEEMAAARALAPSLGACLVQGQTIALRPSNIRAFVADGLWTRYVRYLNLGQAVTK